MKYFTEVNRSVSEQRLFLAVLPPSEVVEVLAGMPRPEAPGLRWTRPHQWHVTLRFLGHADPEDVVAAMASFSWTSAVAELGPVSATLGRHVVMVPVSGLDDLASVVTAATARVGMPPEGRPFVGHLTLARSKGPVPAGSAGTPISASFPVGEVCLVRSRALTDGVEYEVLERFSLA